MIAGVLFGSIGFMVTKLDSSGMSMYASLFWRFFIASIVLVPFLYKKSQVSVSKKSMVLMFFVGAILYGPAVLFYFATNHKAEIKIGTILLFCIPIFLFLVAWYRKYSFISKSVALSACIIVLGLGLLFDNNQTFNVLGVMLLMISAVVYAICVYANKFWSVEVSLYNSVFMVCFGCSVYFLGISMLRGSFILFDDINEWINIILTAVLCTALPILLVVESAKHIDIMQILLLLIAEPLFSFVLSVMGFGEEFNLKQSIGVVIILLAIIIQIIRTKRDSSIS